MKQTIEMTAFEMQNLRFQVGKTGARDTEEMLRLFRLLEKMELTPEEYESCGYTRQPGGAEGMTNPRHLVKRELTQQQLEKLREIAQHPPVPWLAEAYPFVKGLLGKLGVDIEQSEENDS
jgi:hypothetical protein